MIGEIDFLGVIINININNDGASCCSQSGAEQIRRPSDRFDDVSEEGGAGPCEICIDSLTFMI